MTYGAILRKGELFYTNFADVFEKLEGVQNDYNWLVTEAQITASRTPDTLELIEDNKHIWLDGKEMTKAVSDVTQWIWGVLSGFDNSVSEEDALKSPLPWADCNSELWKLPLKMQNPLAKIEMIAFDSTYLLLYTMDKSLYERFRKAYPLSEDLEECIENNFA